MTKKPNPPADDIPVGRIAGAFGIRGELKCDPTSAGRMLFAAGERLRLVLADGSERPVELAGVREHKGRLLIRLRSVECADDARPLAGSTFYAGPERIVLESGEHLDRDLIGCTLYGPAGEALGRVERVEHYPTSDMLVVRGKLVPMVSAFVKSIDTTAGRIVVDVPPGLLNDES